MRDADRLLRATARREAHDLDLRVCVEDPHELRSDVPGRADDRDADPLVARSSRVARERGGTAIRRVRPDPGRAHRRDRPLTGGRRSEGVGLRWIAVIAA